MMEIEVNDDDPQKQEQPVTKLELANKNEIPGAKHPLNDAKE
jgi:hypothetical protein